MGIFQKKILFLTGSKKELTSKTSEELRNSCVFFLLLSQKSQFSLVEILLVPPPFPPIYPSPRRAKSIPSPGAIFGGSTIFEACVIVLFCIVLLFRTV